MAPLPLSQKVQDLFAPYHVIPETKYVTVEHPGVIQNLDNAINSLGGASELRDFLCEEQPPRSIGLRMRPEDRFRRPINSHASITENVILQVTVPKRTGRKRKRGSNDPFRWHEEPSIDLAQTVLTPEQQLRHLQDNPQTSTVTPVGMVEEMHRFRGLPDFQWSLATSTLATTMKNSLLKPDYESLSNFKLDMGKGIVPFAEMMPPPSLAQNSLPFNYGYRQNPNVKLTTDASGRAKTYNVQALPKIETHTVPYDCPSHLLPTAPPAHIPAEHTLEPTLQAWIARLKAYLAKRPIATRRTLLNYLGKEAEYDLKWALQYAGYVFRSGPWRDSIVAFSVDPRSDPKYRIYQTLVFKITIPEGDRDPGKWSRSMRVGFNEEYQGSSHTFDGNSFIPDGKVWQACDISDPLLRSILDAGPLRSECELVQDGWYSNGCWAKVRVVMRDKIQLLTKGVRPDDAVYAKIVAIPNKLSQENLALAQFEKKNDGMRVVEMASDVRALAKVRAAGTERGRVRMTSEGPVVRGKVGGLGEGGEGGKQGGDGEEMGGEVEGIGGGAGEGVVDPLLDDNADAVREVEGIVGGEDADTAMGINQ